MADSGPVQKVCEECDGFYFCFGKVKYCYVCRSERRDRALAKYWAKRIHEIELAPPPPYLRNWVWWLWWVLAACWGLAIASLTAQTCYA